MSGRANINEQSTGLSPRDRVRAERSNDCKKAAAWRRTADEMAKLLNTSKSNLARTGGACETPPTYGRAASRSVLFEGNTVKSAATKNAASKSKATRKHSESDSK